MNREQLRVYADPGTDDPRAHSQHSGENKRHQPRRGEVLRQFLSSMAEHNAEQYPRVQEAFREMSEAMLQLGLDNGDRMKLFERILLDATDAEFTQTVTEMGQRIRGDIVARMAERLGQLEESDAIKFVRLDAALKTVYIRALEVLAVYQKQEREHTASHRAHSSKGSEGTEYFGKPELALEAIEEALRQGVKTIELDVTVLADGTPVVTHSLTTRTDVGKKRIREIPDMDHAAMLGATIDRTGEPLYSLDELLASLEKYKGLAKLNLEIKDPNALPAMVESIKRCGLEGTVMISSFNMEVLRRAHAELPDTTIGANTIVAEHNVGTILADSTDSSEPYILPGGIGVGGNVLPNDPEQKMFGYSFRSLPQELRDMLRETGGYLTIQVPLAKFGYLRDSLRELKHQADAQGIKLLMFRVSTEQAAILRNEIDLLHLDAGEELTYPRMARYAAEETTGQTSV